ncbi:MAG: methyl-accepting chemotaxis protein [Treponema sp.]|jgi:methyl-accepting chemotaxis protein|nr:methyl-accepting chemotaxis protein [Treponema sp.]
MAKIVKGETALKGSINRNFLIFSLFLFFILFIGGSIAFTLSMWQISHTNTGNELAKTIEIERIKLEASVNGEINIVLQMADSTIIQHYFENPANPEMEKIAFEEIAGYRRAFAAKSVFWVNDIDKKFYSDDAYAYTVDVSDPANYWYLMTLNNTDKYNFNINYNPDLDVTNLWINAPVFDSVHKPIGILGTGIDLTSFVNSIYKNYKGPAELYFFNTNGEITGAKNTALVANKAIINKELGVTGAEILARVKNLKPEEFQYFGSTGAGEVAVGEVPALGWYITAILPLTIVDALNNSMTMLFIVMMAVIVVIFIAFYMFISSMLKPMNYMVKTLEQISTDWDLTQRIHLRRQDEIGTLGEFFNLTFEKIEGLLIGIKGKTFALSDTGDELASQMIKTRTDIEKISTNMQGMTTHVLSQSDTVNATARSMESIITGLGKLDEHITVQAESVEQSSLAIEQMLANIESVTQTLVKNTANINTLAESSDAGRADLQKVSTDIQEIARESEGLLEINSVMQTISSQTNLLAMNAAIEAAHAGESGKGFAVVADEIRKLAENSGSQSKTISAVLKKIKVSIDTITKSTGVVLERFGTIEDEVQTVLGQETQIRSAMEGQGTGSQKILDAITQLNSVTDLVRKASSGMIAESKEVLKESVNLKRITGEVAGRMDEITQSSDGISNAITRVQEISEENKENIGALSVEIRKFKLE